jgi:hypothetical protein
MNSTYRPFCYSDRRIRYSFERKLHGRLVCHAGWEWVPLYLGTDRLRLGQLFA